MSYDARKAYPKSRVAAARQSSLREMCAKGVSTESLGLKRMTIMRSVVFSRFRSELSTHRDLQMSCNSNSQGAFISYGPQLLQPRYSAG